MGNAQRKRLMERGKEPGAVRLTSHKRQQVLFLDVLANQSTRGGSPFNKADYVSILIRLDPSYNNALISVYTVDSLRAEIRNIVYAIPPETPEFDVAIEVVN